MARMVVITTSDLAPGYRLAGAPVTEANDQAQADKAVHDLLAIPDVQVIALYEPWLQHLDPSLERRLEQQVVPVVIGLPEASALASEDERRARLAEILHRAIGYRITFREEAP